MKLPAFYIALWVDTATTLGWHAPGEQITPSLALTMGFLYNEDEKFIRVGGTWSDGHQGNVTVILRSAILKDRKFSLPFVKGWFK